MAAVLRLQGDERAGELLRRLQQFASQAGLVMPEAALNTPYLNTISPHLEPRYPGQAGVEGRLENLLRWNAAAMVLGAALRYGGGRGGHIATYLSAATPAEVGFNHFFRGRSADYGGDQLLFQAHAAPGVYARAFLEGRFGEGRLVPSAGS